jgi:hypothetical protein
MNIHFLLTVPRKYAFSRHRNKGDQANTSCSMTLVVTRLVVTHALMIPTKHRFMRPDAAVSSYSLFTCLTAAISQAKFLTNSVLPLRLEVFTAVTMKNAVFWDVMPCDSVKNRRFGGT